MNGDQDELERTLIPRNNTYYASSHILYLSTLSCLSHVLRIVRPRIKHDVSVAYGALVEWTLASTVAGDEAAAAGFLSPEEPYTNQTHLEHETLREAHLTTRDDGHGLTITAVITGAAHVGCQALILCRVVAASAREKLPSLLEWAPNSSELPDEQ